MTIARYKATATEAQMLKALTDTAHALGGATYRVNDSRGQRMTGFPDLLVLVPYRSSPYDMALYGFELKTAYDGVHPAQAWFLDALNRVVIARGDIVRAGRLRDGEITLDEALTMIRGCTVTGTTRERAYDALCAALRDGMVQCCGLGCEDALVDAQLAALDAAGLVVVDRALPPGDREPLGE